MLKRKRIRRNKNGTYNQQDIEHNNKAYLQYAQRLVKNPRFKRFGLTEKEFLKAGLIK
tara:strand:- start:659 stop:832 length:174 start_codon:yes stop_codon:yes gene_type:complete